MSTLKNTTLWVSIIAAIAVIAFASIFAAAYRYKYNVSQTISVTGNAMQDFESDIVKWSASFNRKSTNLSEASQQLEQDRVLVRAFLTGKQISEAEIVFDAVRINREFSYQTDANGNRFNTFTGYSLTQKVSIDSRDLDQVENVSREISELISQGIELSSDAPNYYFSGLEDLKLELISAASENAKSRAENIAQRAGTSLGALTKADLGVFQITGQNENEEYSYGGTFNTRSRKKTANITVKTNYLTR